MGAFLSEPKTEKTHSSSSNEKLRFSVTAMQGWRITMEDAHTCMLDFDVDSSLFAVYDGHGGSEVADYVAKHLPQVIKETESYKEGHLKQSMTDAFMKIDETIVSQEGLEELNELAGLGNAEDDDEDEAELLAKEAAMPLEDLLAKFKKAAEEDAEETGTENSTVESLSGPAPEKENIEEDNLQNGKEKRQTLQQGKRHEDNKGNTKKEDTKAENQKQHLSEEKCENAEEDSEGEEESDEPDDSDDGDNEGEEEEDSGEDDGPEGDVVNDEDEAEQMYPTSDQAGYDSGTTANIAVIRGNRLVVANVGDSRCVLCRNGIAIDMSVDHKPDDTKELQRIEKAGGKVTGDGRINGGLNLSRALGDHSYKCTSDLPAHEQQISALPDVKETELTEADEFLLLACDGIWNVKSSQEAVDFISDRLKKQRFEGNIDLNAIGSELLDACLAPDTSGDGSGCDNMTCIIVLFLQSHLETVDSKAKTGKRKMSQSQDTQNPKKRPRTEQGE